MTKKKHYTWEEALERCMPTILKLAAQFASIPNAVVDKDDLINCGLMGLMEARKNYTNDKATKFTTFAYFRIRGSMLDEIRRYQPHKRNVIEKQKKIEKAQAEVLRFPQGSRAADKRKISKISGFSAKEIDQVA